MQQNDKLRNDRNEMISSTWSDHSIESISELSKYDCCQMGEKKNCTKIKNQFETGKDKIEEWETYGSAVILLNSFRD